MKRISVAVAAFSCVLSRWLAINIYAVGELVRKFVPKTTGSSIFDLSTVLGRRAG